jgi:hypothetical protein
VPGGVAKEDGHAKEFVGEYESAHAARPDGNEQDYNGAVLFLPRGILLHDGRTLVVDGGGPLANGVVA